MFTIPTKCPICNSDVVIEKKHNTEVLFCSNPFCTAKIEGKLLHFIGAHGLDIESMSTATVKDLLKLGWLKEMSDIFNLKDHRDEWVTLKGYGENSVDKIIEGIPTSIECWKLIASAGIPGVEKQTSKLIADYFNEDWDKFREAVDNKYDFTKIKGIGFVTSNDILTFNYDEIDKVKNHLTIKKVIVGGKLANKSFCITGSLTHFSNRTELVKLIEANGGKTASVGNGLDYLICNDVTSTSGKSKKAKELGIPVITEEQFLNMII